jgi:hypothetical protein
MILNTLDLSRVTGAGQTDILRQTQTRHSHKGVNTNPQELALFCMAILEMATKLTSEFNTWCLDDGKLGGSVFSVFNDL